MFFAKIPRHTRQNAITEGDLECILARNCEGTEQLQNEKINALQRRKLQSIYFTYILKTIHIILTIKKVYKWKEAGTFVPARMKKKNIL